MNKLELCFWLAALPFTVLACGEEHVGSLGADGGDAGTSSISDAASTDAGNTLTGTLSFPVHYALVDTNEPASEDGYTTVLPDGSLAAFAILLSEANLGVACSVDGGSNPGSGQPFVDIQVKSPSYAGTGAHPLDGGTPAAIQPGTYAVGFEGLSDDDLSMDSALSLLDLRDFPTVAGGGATTVASATTGSVTLTTVDPGHVVGTFDVTLAAYSSSGFDTANPTHFAGTFDATPCLGTTQ